jgi:hypothetical protein
MMSGDTTAGQRAVYGFRLRNTTGLHLSGGPITVFRSGIYAGDGQINNITPGQSRLISYAVDLDLVVGREQPKYPQETLTAVAKSGVLLISRTRRREQLLTFRNKATEAKTVIVQQPIESGWNLVSPEKPTEKSPVEYRFEVKVPAGKTAELRIVSEQPVRQSLALVDAAVDALVAHASNAQLSAPLRAQLEQLVTRRRKVAELQRQRETLQNELAAIDTEQNRIRQNMQQLDRNSPLYQQYVKKLTAQETRIDAVRSEIARLVAAEETAAQEVRKFAESITVP